MSEDVYRAGIVGLGFIGGADQVSGDALGQRVKDLDGTHPHALQGAARVELVAGSSRDPGRRERFAGRTGARVYADWGEMLAQEQLDIVSVATYTPYHAEVTQACARSGVRAVYCEKPIADTVAAADAMLSACRDAGTLLVVNHNRRFDTNYRRLRDLIAAGGLGELTSVSLRWGRGRLGNVGTHIFDAVVMVTGRRVVAVSATLDLTGRPDCRGAQFRDPGGWGVMRLEGGPMVLVDAADTAEVPLSVVINGTKGRAVTGGAEVTVGPWGGPSETWASTRGETSSMDRAVAEIVAWLDGGGTFPYDAGEAAHVLEAIVAFHASHDRNAAWVPLPLTGEDRERVLRSG